MCWSSQLYSFSPQIFCLLGFLFFPPSKKLYFLWLVLIWNHLVGWARLIHTNYALSPALLVLLYPWWLVPCMDFKLSGDKNPECQMCRRSSPLSVTYGIWRSALIFELLPSSRATDFSSVWIHVCEELYVLSIVRKKFFTVVDIWGSSGPASW